MNRSLLERAFFSRAGHTRTHTKKYHKISAIFIIFTLHRAALSNSSAKYQQYNMHICVPSHLNKISGPLSMTDGWSPLFPLLEFLTVIFSLHVLFFSPISFPLSSPCFIIRIPIHLIVTARKIFYYISHVSSQEYAKKRNEDEETAMK